ncbi:MAG TPA: tRNA pseudouridine(38-40) synthase TruA [Cyclobacteriaceae bacterium]|nr:tRNA pseudouridine(38-40) synthase TruA [Cyclobacteriaceae bacterium]
MENKRYFLELAYKGSGFHGWQIQANAHTVQEEINKALSTVLKFPVESMGSGRTDAGVHARQQYIHFDSPHALEKASLLKRLNAILPKEVAVYDLREVMPDAHARFSAISRSYLYYISLRKNPFEEGLSWLYYQALDPDKMNRAAEVLLEYRDFECFSKVKTEVSHFECEIKEAFWEQKDHHLIFHITANRFLRGMVRAIVGTMVQVGVGRIDLNGFRAIIESKKRDNAGISVPPQGLYLSSVAYPEAIFI